MPKKLFSWFLLVGLTIAMASSASAQTRKGYVRLTRIGERVLVEDQAKTTTEYKRDQNGAKITEDNLVITTGEDSRVILVFSNGATINLGANSKMDILAFRQDPFAGDFAMKDASSEPPAASRTEIFLRSGELVGNVKKLNPESTFIVKTPAGAAGIRGTTFRVVFRPTGTGQAFFSVTTLEGNVGVTAGEGTTTAPISVLDTQEVEILVDLDPQTGVATVLTDVANLVASAAPTESLASISQTTQQIESAVVDIVITAAADQVDVPTTNSTTEETTQSSDDESTSDETTESPPAETTTTEPTPPTETPPAETTTTEPAPTPTPTSPTTKPPAEPPTVPGSNPTSTPKAGGGS